nr:uncharacterized protein LOC129037431 isoform X2 [Pongo pygmaeus]XP_054345527.1 uncharacterized protein LOC129037431 isoform X2 [Pongo pygmaeus]
MTKREREREREKRAGGEEQKAGGEIWHNGWERKLDASGPPFARASLEPAPLFLPSWIWGAALPGAGRSNETAKKHKMNRQSNQPKEIALEMRKQTYGDLRD